MSLARYAVAEERAFQLFVKHQRLATRYWKAYEKARRAAQRAELREKIEVW